MAQEVHFEQVVAKGCGLDVHKETVVATVFGTAIQTETRTFLTELRDWFDEKKKEGQIKYYQNRLQKQYMFIFNYLTRAAYCQFSNENC